MSFLGPSIFHAAPQTLGHPLALPAAPPPPAADNRVPPAPGAESSGLDHDLGRRHGAPARGRRDGHSAPPSILQMKIDSLLREQAERRAEEAADAAQKPAQHTGAAAARPGSRDDTGAETPREERTGAQASQAAAPPTAPALDAADVTRKGS